MTQVGFQPQRATALKITEPRTTKTTLDRGIAIA